MLFQKFHRYFLSRNGFDLQYNEKIAKLIREYHGRGCIEPNLNGLEVDNDFGYIKMPFDIHPRD